MSNKKGCFAYPRGSAYPIEYDKQTLCWDCQNASPNNDGRGCSWSRAFIPVDGWVATPSKIQKTSFRVIKCPEFVPDESPWMRYVNAIEAGVSDDNGIDWTVDLD